MYKILSLDGGGSWAVLQILTLKARYGNIKGHEILRNYDMVVANSGGSIVLAALCEDWTLDQALDLFQEETNRKRIFSKNTFSERFFPIDYIRFFGGSFGPKYSSKRKREAFGFLFSECDKRQMNELPKFIGKESLKLIVCTYDALNNRAKFFQSFGSGPYFDSVKLTQAIHGSSNAPIQYFDFPARFKAKNSEIFYELWDGALGGFNNPVIVGLIEAIKNGVNKKDIYIISIGTGNKIMSMEEKTEFFQNKDTAIRFRKKKFHLNKLLSQFRFFSKSILQQAKTILYQPPDWANYITKVFLYESNTDSTSNRFLRLSPLLHVDNDSPEKLKFFMSKLNVLDMDLVAARDIELLFECFEKWQNGQIKNHPIEFQVTRENEVIYLEGQQEFAEVMKLWEDLGI